MRNTKATLIFRIVVMIVSSSSSSSSIVGAFATTKRPTRSSSELRSASIALSSNNRHVCLFDNYRTVQGPYFRALFDQILQEQAGIEQRRIALCTCQVHAERVSTDLLPAIQQDLLVQDDDSCTLIILDEHNPLSLQETIMKEPHLEPTIFWVVDYDNAFRIRYKMRTSGLDKIIERLCGSDNIDDKGSSLYIGEGAGGTICAGASLATAHALGQDPKQAPEPQFRGLELLGPQRSLFITNNEDLLLEHPKIKSSSSRKNHEFLTIQDDQIYVWSQVPSEEVTSFVFLPCQRGGMEKLTSPPPVPPLVETTNSIMMMGGVQCDGEPSIDPSRMMQEIGDSEWINEAEG